MSQQYIDIGNVANDGTGDPLRTAFTKCNDNFSELYNIGGITGIANGTSNVQVSFDDVVQISSANVANVLVVSSTGATVTGTLIADSAISATGNITGDTLITTGDFIVIPVGTSDPASPVAGAMYFNSTGAGNLRIYDGSSWVSR